MRNFEFKKTTSEIISYKQSEEDKLSEISIKQDLAINSRPNQAAPTQSAFSNYFVTTSSETLIPSQQTQPQIQNSNLKHEQHSTIGEATLQQNNHSKIQTTHKNSTINSKMRIKGQFEEEEDINTIINQYQKSGYNLNRGTRLQLQENQNEKQTEIRTIKKQIHYHGQSQKKMKKSYGVIFRQSIRNGDNRGGNSRRRELNENGSLRNQDIYFNGTFGETRKVGQERKSVKHPIVNKLMLVECPELIHAQDSENHSAKRKNDLARAFAILDRMK